MQEHIIHVEGDSVHQLPHTALQAIYHAVTGKTENLSDSLKGNVIIDFDGIAQLYHRLIQQLEHYNIVSGPTVTIIVKQANEKSLQYSSWERFRLFEVNDNEVTSEVSIKLEFLLILPKTNTPQRCIIHVNIDSGLPVVIEAKQSDLFAPPFELLPFFIMDYKTVSISIDFVDFLVAKVFCSVIKEWFSTLSKVPSPSLSKMMIKKSSLINSIISQTGRIGLATFLFTYVLLSHGDISDIGSLVKSGAIGLFFWSLLTIASTSVAKNIVRRLYCNIVPSIIILSNGDRKAFSEIESKINHCSITAMSVAGTMVGGIVLNILASYIFVYLNEK